MWSLPSAWACRLALPAACQSAGARRIYRRVPGHAAAGQDRSRRDRLRRDQNERHANARAVAFETAVVAFPEVIACHMVSGDADYLLEVVVPDIDHYREFLVGKLLELSI